MSFFINSINPFAFPGQIIAYLGTTDPDGWVICDGLERDWHTKYQSLITMSIGAKNGAGTKYIPPDLSNCLLRGKDSTNDIKTISGSNSNVSVNINHFPNHNHGTSTSSGVTTASHSHTYTDYYYSDSGTNNNTIDGELGDGTPGDIRVERTTSTGTYTEHTVTITAAGTNNNVSISIQNYGYRVYWILKY